MLLEKKEQIKIENRKKENNLDLDVVFLTQMMTTLVTVSQSDNENKKYIKKKKGIFIHTGRSPLGTREIIFLF